MTLEEFNMYMEARFKQLINALCPPQKENDEEGDGE